MSFLASKDTPRSGIHVLLTILSSQFLPKNITRLVIAGETLLEEVVVMAAKVGLVKPQDHIVCVQRMGESFVIKIVSVNDSGDGVEIIRPKSLINLIRVGQPFPFLFFWLL